MKYSKYYNNVNDDFNAINDFDEMCFILNEPTMYRIVLKLDTISYTIEDV